jgi:phosphonoacetaldehyde hydrolase
VSIAGSMGVAAIVMDWAGTAVDFGCMAPVESLVEVFGCRGVEITTVEARGPMGLEKKEHIRVLLGEPAIRDRWASATGALPRPLDAESLFAELEPALLCSARRFCSLVPGALELAEALRERKIALGSTTGYSPAVMSVVVEEARRQGFLPDVVVTPADVPAGRPAPWMCLLAAMRLGTYPLWRMVKIGDTAVDIHEGLNAGMWTIGVTESGNEVGLPLERFAELSEQKRRERVTAATTRLRHAGAHYVTAGAWSCLPIIEEIDARIRGGDMPPRGACA